MITLPGTSACIGYGYSLLLIAFGHSSWTEEDETAFTREVCSFFAGYPRHQTLCVSQTYIAEFSW